MEKTIAFLRKRFSKGEPIFMSDIPDFGRSQGAVRKEVSRMVSRGELTRVRRGIYILPYESIFGTEGKMSVRKYLERKYLLDAEGKPMGYSAGIQLASEAGLTTQVPVIYEITSNAATTRFRKETLNGVRIFVHKPVAEITEENAKALQFLDLVMDIDRYSDIRGMELKEQLLRYAGRIKVPIDSLREYLMYYPKEIYTLLNEAGLLDEVIKED